jgi:hypothetical protein
MKRFARGEGVVYLRKRYQFFHAIVPGRKMTIFKAAPGSFFIHKTQFQ